MAELINPAPEVHERRASKWQPKAAGEAPDEADIFEFIRDIQDPEHPYSLEQLNVVQEKLIKLDNGKRHCLCALDRCSPEMWQPLIACPCFRVRIVEPLRAPLYTHS